MSNLTCRPSNKFIIKHHSSISILHPFDTRVTALYLWDFHMIAWRGKINIEEMGEDRRHWLYR